MRTALYTLLTFVALTLLMNQCANPGTLTGGPKDTIPPILQTAFPNQGALNVTEQTITLVFSERISIEKLKDNLIITPTLSSKYKTIVKKNTLILRFDEPFPEETTITFNFFDGVTDVTEKNPAVNLRLVFSTGSWLDSMQVSGNVAELLTGNKQKGTIVGLFAYHDSLNIFKTKPTYFTQCSEDGKFNIQNIKAGEYKLVAFLDKNRNLILDPGSEMYGFKKGTIQLDSAISNISLPMVRVDATEFRKPVARANGNYYDVKYTKAPNTVTLNQPFPYHLLDAKTIRIYQPSHISVADSISTSFHLTDSLGNIQFDTLMVKFNDNIRKPGAFTLTTEPANNQPLFLSKPLVINFTKPVLQFDSSKMKFGKDTLITLPQESFKSFKWNTYKTQLSIVTGIDTLNFYKRQQARYSQDTAKLDSAKKLQVKPFTLSRQLDLIIEKGAFISAQQDTLKSQKNTFKLVRADELGILRLKVTTEYTHYTVQLLDKNFKLLAEQPGNNALIFRNIVPQEIIIRALIDTNKDGQWSFGNILRDLEPEPIYIHPGTLSIRANWDITMDISF
jgi:hypothetical protein